MSIILFNIGLSLLSRDSGCRKAEALRILSLFEGRIITEKDIKKEDGGRPYFKHGTSDFNISHSEDMVAVSHLRGEGLQTGCDIQLVKERTNTLRIAEQFFSPAENEYILTQNEKDNKTAFFEIWTLKESFIKMHGLSVFDMSPKGCTASVPDFVDKDGNLSLTPEGISFFLFKLNGNNGQQYILATAIKGGNATPQVKWFSESSLSLDLL